MRTSKLAALVAAVALIAPASIAIGTTSASATEVRGGINLPDFYDPPASIPSTPGTVIRSEAMAKAVNGPIFPGTSTRLMYSTIDSNGVPAPATGAFIQSTKAWNGPGARPVIGFAVGTIGQGDQCSPSYGLEHPLVAGLNNGEMTIGLNYEMIQISALLNKGYNVAMTDYIGLGSTDRLHTYMNRLDQSHALLDVVRAVRNLPGSPVTSSTKVGLWGYSQGGGASAAAAELQATYAPELNVVGTYAGAPPADLTQVVDGVDGNMIAGVLGFTLNGLVQSYPQLQPIMAARMNVAGAAALQDISTMCIGDIIFKYGFSKSSSWTKDGKSLSQIIKEEPAAQAVVNAQKIGNIKPKAPVLVTTDLADGTVPHKQARQLAVDWCGKGARVTYTPLGLPRLPFDTDRATIHHLAGMIEGLPGALRWMQDRFAGKSSSNTCGWMWLRP